MEGGAVIFLSLLHYIMPRFNYCPACKHEAAGRGIAIRAVIEVGHNKFFQGGKYKLQGGTLIFIEKFIMALFNKGGK